MRCSNGMAGGGQADDRTGRLVLTSHDARVHGDLAGFVQHRPFSSVEQGLVFHRFNGEGDGLERREFTGVESTSKVVEQGLHAGHALRVGVGHAAPRSVASCTTVHGEDHHVTTSLDDGAADDLLRFSGAVAGEFSTSLDGVNDVHAFGHGAKDGVVAVEPGGWHRREEELRATGVPAGVGHGEHTRLVVLQGKGGGFAGNLPAGATGAGSASHGVLGVRTAALNHEVLDHTMEVKSVVVAHLDQFDEIGDGVGGTAVEEVDGDVACAGFHENLHA